MERAQYQKILSSLRTENVYLYGVPCVGKTYAATWIANASKINYIYLDLAIESSFREALELQIYFEKLEDILAKEVGLEPATFLKTLLILDGIDYLSDKCIKSLFHKLPKQNTLVIGTLPPDMYGIDERIASHRMNPFSFGEFLEATGHQNYLEMLEAHKAYQKPISEFFHDDIMEMFLNYLLTGGFPEVIRRAKEVNFDISAINSVHKMILHTIEYELLEITERFHICNSTHLKALLKLAKSEIKEYKSSLTISKGFSNLTLQDLTAEFDFLARSGYCRVSRQNKGLRIEPADVGIMRFWACDYELFMQLEDPKECPIYILQNFLYSTLSSDLKEIETMHSSRNGYLHFVDSSNKTAYICIGKYTAKQTISAFKKMINDYQYFVISPSTNNLHKMGDCDIHNISYIDFFEPQE